jgi:hypothetical protein
LEAILKGPERFNLSIVEVTKDHYSFFPLGDLYELIDQLLVCCRNLGGSAFTVIQILT